MNELITQHLDFWTSAVASKATAGRGNKSPSPTHPIGHKGEGRGEGNPTNTRNAKVTAYGIKKLRELILELAVRGKLVPQDPNDESFAVGPNTTRLCKEKLAVIDKIKKKKPLTDITDEEKIFAIPVGWKWERLDSITSKITDGEHLSPQKTQSGMKLLTAKHVLDNGITLDDPQYVSLEDGVRFRDRCDPQTGDVLICSRGTIGRCCAIEVTEEFCLMGSVILVRPLPHVNPRYLDYFLKSEAGQFFIRGATKGMAVNALYLKDIRICPISVPPLAEQHRIVAKVDELMALCDQLEQQQTDHLAAHQTLVQTLLDTLTQAADAAEFEQAWNRIADHFDTLFITESSIDQLKQTLLQLAVMGKLVPQDPNDEPASVLLDKITDKKAWLVKEGKTKTQKPFADIADEAKVFEIPSSWEWGRLGSVSVLKGGFAYNSASFISSGKHQVIRMGNIRPDCLRINENPVYISPELGTETIDYRIEPNDILLTMTGTNGKRDYLYSLMVKPENCEDRDLYLNQRLCIVRILLLSPEFLNMIIKDDRLLDAIYAQSTGTANQANIGMAALSNWVIPIPPIEEQNRIVSKVDELMALCDTLKARIAAAQTTQLQLADAIVEQAVA